MTGKNRPTPILKWAGGKTQLLDQLFLGIEPGKIQRYFEPFAGGLAFFFALRTRGYEGWAFINDMNADLVALYLNVQQRLPEFLELYQDVIALWNKTDNRAGFYEAMRLGMAGEEDWLHRAVRLAVINKLCHSGLYRVSSTGVFNTPIASDIRDEGKQPSFTSVFKFVEANVALANTDITHGDYTLCIPATGRPDDLYFFDPPYDPLPGKQSFVEYTNAVFGQEQQRALKRHCDALRASGSAVIVSNSDTPFINELWHDWHIQKVRARRAIDSSGKGRADCGEVIIRSEDVTTCSAK